MAAMTARRQQTGKAAADPCSADVPTLTDDADGRHALQRDRPVFGSGAPLVAAGGPCRQTISAS